jgi:hypothetical protein
MNCLVRRVHKVAATGRTIVPRSVLSAVGGTEDVGVRLRRDLYHDRRGA